MCFIIKLSGCLASSVFLSYVIFFFFVNFFFFNFFFFDASTKVSITDSFFSFNSFFWTNVFVMLFFSALFLIILSWNVVSPFFQILMFSLLAIYIAEINSFFLSSARLSFISLTNTDINSFLTNSLNKYHPPLLFASILVFYKSFFLYFTNTRLLKKIIFFLNTAVLVNALSLFLGAWWAVQEGSWGGWWNWDPSETLGLLISLSALIIYHFFLTQKINKTALSFALWEAALLFAFVYIFVQLNFELTSHNFGIKFFFFFNNNFFLIETIYLLASASITLFLWNHYYLNLYQFFLKKKKKSNRALFGIFSIFILITWITWTSFAGAISFFFYDVLSLTIFAKNSLNSAALLFFLLFSLSFQKFKILTPFMIIFFYDAFFFYYICFNCKAVAHGSHVVSLVLINNFFLIDAFHYSTFTTSSDLCDLYFFLSKKISQYGINAISAFSVEISQISAISHFTQNNSISSVNLFAQTVINGQELLFRHNFFLSRLLIGADYSTVSLIAEIKFSSQLYLLVLVFLGLLMPR